MDIFTLYLAKSPSYHEVQTFQDALNLEIELAESDIILKVTKRVVMGVGKPAQNPPF